MTKKDKKYWKIQGWDGTNLLFERKVLLGQVTERSMKELLRTLTARIALSEDEIISSYAKRRTKTYYNHLEVTRPKAGSFMLSCGDGPFVTATVENCFIDVSDKARV